MSVSPNVEELIIRTYAKKYNVPEEQARQILAPLLAKKDKIEELNKLMYELGLLGETMEKLPDDAKPLASTMILKDILREDEDDIRDMLKQVRNIALQIKLVETVFKSMGFGAEQQSNPMVEELRRQNEELRKQNELLMKKIEELEKTIEERKRKEEIEKLKEELTNKIADLEKQLQNMLNNVARNPQLAQSQDFLSKIQEISQTIEHTKKLLETVGFKVTAGKEVVVPPKEEYEIRKTKADAVSKFISEHIGPAIAELLKNPSKLVDLLNAIRAMNQNIPQTQQIMKPTQVKVEKPPSLEEVMSKYAGGEKAETKK